jgi:hypothetical protein
VRQAFQWLRRRPWVVVVTVAAVVGLALLYQLPTLLVPDTDASDPSSFTTAERLKAENDLRTTILQVVGGTALLAGLFFTARTYVLNREGQVTERFTRAIDQLGSVKNLDVRLGGIYALERIARDSPRDHWAIMEVLTAFVRGRVPWVVADGQEKGPDGGEGSEPEPPAADVQAVLTVLRRRNRTHEEEGERLQLHRTDLRGADLREAHLEGASLGGANLEGADLYGAHLEGAILVEANLRGAKLTDAHLEDATLVEANLRAPTSTGLTWKVPTSLRPRD